MKTQLWTLSIRHIIAAAITISSYVFDLQTKLNSLSCLFLDVTRVFLVAILAVDSGTYVDTLYSWSALNTEAIGEKIGEGLALLSESYPLEKIHLIGHSPGAHIVGSAGRTFNYKTEKLLPRITGLDPASPCFNEGESLSSLERGDADFVAIIHTNVGVLGKKESIGDADFYPNG